MDSRRCLELLVRPQPREPAPWRRARSGLGLALVLCLALQAGSCRSGPDPIPDQALAALTAVGRPARYLESNHRGPKVAPGDTVTARFAKSLHAAFEEQRAMALVKFVDGYYRSPGNEGYEAVLEKLHGQLAAAGFGTDPRLKLFFIETPLEAPHWGKSGRFPVKAWTPLAGSLVLHGAGEPKTLHAFDQPSGIDRVMLPVHCDSFEIEGPVASNLESVTKGSLLVTSAVPSRALLSRAHAMGALGVVSGYLETYNQDPLGKNRHLDAIHYHQLPASTPLPVLMISPRSLEIIAQAAKRPEGAKLKAMGQVRWDDRKLRTLAAVVQGTDRAQEAVTVASHVQEPGACDNASGVAGLAESAISLAGLLAKETLAWPSRSLVFLWGDEFRQTSAWLDSTDMTPVAGLSSDMTGESMEKTGAIALLERMPDPAALVYLPPDEHTPWGKKEVSPDSLLPNALAVIARCALIDVANVAGSTWTTAEHPYEGGSDHDIFIERKIPTALFWHFTDFAYHTSLDRMDMVDAKEMRRTAAAILSTALVLADPKPTDLDRILRSLDAEQQVRVQAAEAAGDPELKERWLQWCTAAREWARIECLRIRPDQR